MNADNARPSAWTEPKRELARISHADIGEVYNGILGLVVTFEYEGCGVQGLGGYMLEAAMIARFMRAVNVTRLSNAVGKSCWVTHTHDSITKIEPLHAKDGTPFDIPEWQAWVKATLPPLSWSKLLGDNPASHD